VCNIETLETQRECRIRYGRIIVLILIFAWLTTIVCLALFQAQHERQSWVPETAIFGAAFLTLFILIITTLFCLARRLKTQSRLLSTSTVSLRKETCFLVCTLSILSLSYLVRVIYDWLPEDDSPGNSFKLNMLAQTSGVPFDIVPVVMLLCLHRRNLKNAKLFCELQGRSSPIEPRKKPSGYLTPNLMSSSNTSSADASENALKSASTRKGPSD